MTERWRLRCIGAHSRLDIWISFNYYYDEAISKVIKDLDAAVYPSVNVIIFHNKEDILVFRLKAGV